MPLLFSYGTLQQENVQLATFGRRLEGGRDSLVGFRQSMLEMTDPEVIATSGKRHHPIATWSGDPSQQIVGTAFVVAPEELQQADRYETNPAYRRIEARLLSGRDAWVYADARPGHARQEFLLLSRGQWDAHASPEDVQRAIDRFYAWLESHIAAGRMKTGSRLRTDGRLVSRAGITDGPFAETKELVGGYWFVYAGSLDEAAALAADNPCKAFGLSYEIRPLEAQKAVAGSLANETPAAWRR
jgi:hypothetical protein